MVDTQLSRDGTILDLTGPVVTGTIFTYTIQLDSFTRNDSGNYVCTATVRPQSTSTYLTGSALLFNSIHIQAVIPPPLNVQASQSSASAPVEVSWSPPSGGAATITGYRIFYSNHENVSVAPIFTGVALNINQDAVGQMVSIRSEADQLASELVTTSISATEDNKLDQSVVVTNPCSCSTEVGVTAAVILLVCLVAMVINVLITCWWRKRRTGKISFDLPGNVSQAAAVYEEPDKLVNKVSQQGNYELTQCPAYESTTSKPQPQPTEAQSSHYEM